MSATAEKMLADLKLLVCSALSDAKKQECIDIAYGIGISDGRVAGAEDMGATMMASFDRAAAKVSA